MINPEARKRLARLMDQRRLELRLTWRQVAEAADISYEALRAARNGTGDIRAFTQTGIENALRWERGSVGLILAGRDPVPAATPSAPAHPDPPPAPRASIRSILPRDRWDEVAPYVSLAMSAVDAARAIHPGGRLTGAMVFPDDRVAAAQWDRIAGRGEIIYPGEGFAPEQVAESLGLVWERIARHQGESGDMAGLSRFRIDRATIGRRGGKTVAARMCRASSKQARPRGRRSRAGAMINP